VQKIGLTPVIEDLAELNLSSMKKGSKDDFGLRPETLLPLEKVDQPSENLSQRNRKPEPGVAK